jgi:tetratricopeptide (TPR) repeat protein/predicted Ser/Thr protein kinase
VTRERHDDDQHDSGSAPATTGSGLALGELPRPEADAFALWQQQQRLLTTMFGVRSEPAQFDHYVILEELGTGGMGVVYAAYDRVLDRKIALKLIKTRHEPQMQTRLEREAKAMAKLAHPNVVQVYAIGDVEGTRFIAMEFVNGVTLRKWLEAPRSPAEILSTFTAAGRGLAAAHGVGLVHRDFKPDNVMVRDDGRVLVMDFGLAGGDLEASMPEFSLDAGSDAMTPSDTLMGTPVYMAPEQWRGAKVSAAADQFGFCVTLYEALYGERPFVADDGAELRTLVSTGTVRPPPRNSGVPTWLRNVILRGLEVEPKARWPSMETLLSAIAKGPSIFRRRRRWAIAAVSLATAAAVAIVINLQEHSQVNRCEALGQEVEQYWNNARRKDIEAAFDRSDKPYADDAVRRVIETLDRWSADWRGAKVAICEATQSGEQSEYLLDVRMYCLDQRANEVEAIVEVFADADDEIVEHSVAAVHALGDPDACTNVRDAGEFKERKLPPDVLEQVEAMEADLDRAHALAMLEKFDESLPLQTRVAARARELSHPWPWTLTRALFELSESQCETGDYAGAEASLREVIRRAADVDDVEQEFEAWSRLIFCIGGKHNQIAKGHAWSLGAESALVRSDGGRRLKIRYESSLASLALAESKPDVAIGHYNTSLELARAEYGEDHSMTLRMMMMRAVALVRDEQLDEAENAMLEVVTRSKEVYGPTHPSLAPVYFNLGSVHQKNQKFEQAEAAFRASLNIYEQIGGPDAAMLARSLHSLGKVARELDRLDEALSNIQRATEIFIKSQGENSSEVAAAVIDIGRTQHLLGRYDDARASFDRAQAIYNNIYPNGHRHVGGLMERRCQMFVDAKLYADAVASCEIALAIAERFDLTLEFERGIYEKLIVAERGRGRAIAAERAQERLDEVLADIAEEAATVKATGNAGKLAGPE